MDPAKHTPANFALLIDYENLPLDESRLDDLLAQLAVHGKFLIKRAYGDWGQLSAIKKYLSRSAFEIVELPVVARGKNCGDIRLAVDAVEIALLKQYIQGFVIVSGDSDFTPLVARLREYNKQVVVVARRDSVSAMLAGACDQLILLAPKTAAPIKQPPQCDQPKKNKQLEPLGRAVADIIRETSIHGTEAAIFSKLKREITNRMPEFRESLYGVRRFKSLFNMLVQAGVVRLEPTDANSSLYTMLLATDSEPDRKLAESSSADAETGVDEAPAEADLPTATIEQTNGAVPHVSANEETQVTRKRQTIAPPLAADLLDRIYWTCAFRLEPGETSISLTRLIGGFRKLYPDRSPRDYGFPRSGGFLKLAQVMELERWCDIACGPGKSQYTLTFLPCFFEREVALEMPEQLVSTATPEESSRCSIYSFPAGGQKKYADGWLPF